MNALFRGLMVSVVAVTLVASAAIGANAASEFGSFCWDVRRMTDNVRIAFLRLQVTQHSAIEFSLHGEEKVRSHSVNGSGYVDPVFGWVMGVTNTRNPTSMAMGGDIDVNTGDGPGYFRDGTTTTNVNFLIWPCALGPASNPAAARE